MGGPRAWLPSPSFRPPLEVRIAQPFAGLPALTLVVASIASISSGVPDRPDHREKQSIESAQLTNAGHGCGVDRGSKRDVAE